MTRQIIPILALLGSMVFLMLGGGLQSIVIPVRGQIEGFTSFQLGWIGTGWAIGFTIGCIVVPRLVRRAGHVRTFATLVALLVLLGIGWGVTQPLAKIAVSDGYRHFGLVFWQLAISQNIHDSKSLGCPSSVMKSCAHGCPSVGPLDWT